MLLKSPKKTHQKKKENVFFVMLAVPLKMSSQIKFRMPASLSTTSISCLQNIFHQNPLNQVLAIIGSRYSGPLAEGRWFFCNKVTCCTKTNGRRSGRSGQKVQDKSEMRNPYGSGVLNKKRPLSGTKIGRLLAQKMADLLY